MKAEYDFSQGKRGAINPIKNNQAKITINLDKDILNWLRETVDCNDGGDYQDLINNILRNYISQQNESLETMLRRILREELAQK